MPFHENCLRGSSYVFLANFITINYHCILFINLLFHNYVLIFLEQSPYLLNSLYAQGTVGIFFQLGNNLSYIIVKDTNTIL